MWDTKNFLCAAAHLNPWSHTSEGLIGDYCQGFMLMFGECIPEWSEQPESNPR